MLKEILIGTGGVALGVGGTYLAQNFISNSETKDDSKSDSSNDDSKDSKNAVKDES